MLAGVINEQLRVYQPFAIIPKIVATDSPRALMIDGQKIHLPAKTRIGLSAVRVYRNPKYWPHSVLKGYPLRKNNLEDFVSERWTEGTKPALGSDSDDKFMAATVDNEEDHGGPRSSDTSEKHFQPARRPWRIHSVQRRATSLHRTAVRTRRLVCDILLYPL
jgi:hypothetical protein